MPHANFGPDALKTVARTDLFLYKQDDKDNALIGGVAGIKS